MRPFEFDYKSNIETCRLQCGMSGCICAVSVGRLKTSGIGNEPSDFPGPSLLIS